MPVLPVLEPLCQQAPPGSNTTTRLSLSFEKFVNILNGVLLPHTVPGNSTFSHVPYASRGGFSISVESLLLLHAANATSAKPQLLMRPRYTMNSPHLLLPGGSPRVRGEQILGAALYQTVHVMPQKPSALAELPDDVDSVLALALAKDPAARFPSADELHTAIAHALDGHLAPRQRRRAQDQLAAHPWGATR